MPPSAQVALNAILVRFVPDLAERREHGVPSGRRPIATAGPSPCSRRSAYTRASCWNAAGKLGPVAWKRDLIHKLLRTGLTYGELPRATSPPVEEVPRSPREPLTNP
jgi:hypothetical protein